MIDYDKVFEEMPTLEPKVNLEGQTLICTGAPKRVDFDVSVTKSEMGENKVREIVEKAEGFIVETDEEAQKGLSIALSARRRGKEISKLRKRLTEPALRFQKEAIKIEKEFTDQLDQVERDLFEKIEIYQEQRKASLATNNIIDDSFDKLKVDLGSSSVISYFEFKIENFDEIPKQYLKLDEKKLKEDIKNGIRNVPGVEIFEIKKKQYRLNGSKK